MKQLITDCKCHFAYYAAGLAVLSFSLGAVVACTFFAAVMGGN